MSRDEAIQIIRKYEINFKAEDAMFGDGSHTLHYEYVLDSKKEAEELADAMKLLLSEYSQDV